MSIIKIANRIPGSNQEPEFAVTRICSGPSDWEKAPAYPRDQAVLICVSLLPATMGQWRAVYNGKSVGVTKEIAFATTFIDLNCKIEIWARGPFDYLHYYLSQELLERIALDNGVSASFRLQEAFFIEDLVVAQMTKSVLRHIECGEPIDQLALDQIKLVLGAHTLQAHGGMPALQARLGQGLETWQKLRIEDMFRAHLGGNITVRELANSCGLSASHFARCFRMSFGTSVHQRLIQLRHEHAKQLLSKTKKTLAEIALLSGFYDQAALSRTFSRIEHVSPSSWRRMHREGKSATENDLLPANLR